MIEKVFKENQKALENFSNLDIKLSLSLTFEQMHQPFSLSVTKFRKQQ